MSHYTQMKYFLLFISILITSLLLNYILTINNSYERSLNEDFPDRVFIYLNKDVVDIKGNALVAGWPSYSIIDKPAVGSEGELSIQHDELILNRFLFNWAFIFFLVFGASCSLKGLLRFFKAPTFKKIQFKKNSFLFFFSLLITFYSSYFCSYKREVGGNFSQADDWSYYQFKDRKNNLLVGGWPFYHVVDNPKMSFAGKLSLVEWDYVNGFAFWTNFLLIYLALLGVVNLSLESKRKIKLFV